MITKERTQAVQGSPVTLLYRATKTDGTPILKADVTSITLHSQNLTDATSAGTVTYTAINNGLNTVVYDTDQLDARWQKDKTGYGIALIVPASLMPIGAKEYQIDPKITFANGETDNLRPYIVEVQKTYGA